MSSSIYYSIYYYKDKPYKILYESKVKYEGKWIPVIIYICQYDNPDGRIWVRERIEFFAKFKKQE